MLACWHGVDHELVTVFEHEHDRLEETRTGVEAEPQFAVWPVIVFERLHPLRPVGCVGGVLGAHAMLEGAGVDVHAA